MSIKVDQALISTFRTNNSSTYGFGSNVAYENKFFEPPKDGSPYAEVKVISNPKSPVSVNNTDEVVGIFRVILHYPKDKGAVAAKVKAEQIISDFKIGTRLTYGGQKVRITQSGRQQGVPEDGWYKIVIDIYYQAFLARS